MSKENLLRELSVMRGELAGMRPSALLGLLSNTEMLLTWAFGPTPDEQIELLNRNLLPEILSPIIAAVAEEFDSRFQAITR